ncbi:MAG: UTP--glucose-1-phosphate uridylyltransferase GalU [Gammaproteobacteria bacterium]|nr:UTP--glucose-1-phosphate uridylyltransferase GalU [Gammaproteobacteria bacterium]
MAVKVTKAVFPVAGLGTRFLPATKANPKEMLPIVDKPLIQYAVEEAMAAGITQLIFVTSNSKRAIEDHFDSNFELEAKLESDHRDDLLALVRGIIPEGVSCVYVRQPEQLGLGHAVYCAKDIVGNEPFAVLLADDLISSENGYCLQEMLDIYDATNNSVLAIQEVDMADVSKYGVVGVKQSGNGSVAASIVEKPEVSAAPSNLAVVGRYVLTPAIFSFLESLSVGKGGEYQLTDAIAKLLNEEEVRLCQFSSVRYDCGSKLGYLKATLEFALNHCEVGAEFKEYLHARFQSA